MSSRMNSYALPHLRDYLESNICKLEYLFWTKANFVDIESYDFVKKTHTVQDKYFEVFNFWRVHDATV